MGIERAVCGAGDAGEDLVCGLGPDEGPGFRVVDVDEFSDRFLELKDATVAAATDLFLRQLGEPALDEIEPGAVGRVKWTWKRGRLANQLRMTAVLWVP